MPKIITNANERQAHPIYPNVRTKNHHMTDKQHAEMSETNNCNSEDLRCNQKRRRSGCSPEGRTSSLVRDDMKAKGKKY